MRIDKKVGNQERRILIGMIVDPIVLAKISTVWESRAFKSKWANIIAKWCLDYYEHYGKAPKKQIEAMFESWSAKTKDGTTVDLIEKLLASLSEEYENLGSESNSDYVLDIAANYFNQVKIERLIEQVEADIIAGHQDKAHQRLVKYTKIEMGVGESIDVFQDYNAIREAFDKDQKEILIQFSDALGEFFSDSLEREGFIAFMGKKGVGKSWWLITMAYQAMLQRKKVVMFEVGDMGRSQVIKRFMMRAAKHPRNAGDVYWPTKIWYDKNRGSVRRRFNIIEFPQKLNWREAKKACDKVMHRKVKSKKSYFKLSCHFNSTLKVDGVESVLRDWERRTGWTPDVVVIDYADILNMEYPGIEGRDRINETWKRLRALSQRWHCLVITATQADADSYDRETLKMKNFSDDRRKIDSVTGMIGINQTESEKKRGIMRLNWISLRDAPFHPTKCVHIAGCLAVGNPAVKSCF